MTNDILLAGLQCTLISTFITNYHLICSVFDTPYTKRETLSYERRFIFTLSHYLSILIFQHNLMLHLTFPGFCTEGTVTLVKNVYVEAEI